LRADPEEKQGLAKNIERQGIGQLGKRLTSTRRIEKSRHLVERVEPEALRLGYPVLADVLIGGEAAQGLEPSGEVVGGEEVAQVTPQLVMSVVVVAPDSGVLEGAVPPLDLSVRPGMARFGQAVIDVILGTGELERMCPEDLAACYRLLDQRSSRTGVAGRGEVGSVIGEYGV
jgi:hypothetical protein